MEKIQYTVDGEPQSTTAHRMTAVEIMQAAGVDPTAHYLVEIRGDHHQVSFKDNPNESIVMHPNMKFITNSLGPTPVS